MPAEIPQTGPALPRRARAWAPAALAAAALLNLSPDAGAQEGGRNLQPNAGNGKVKGNNPSLTHMGEFSSEVPAPKTVPAATDVPTTDADLKAIPAQQAQQAETAKKTEASKATQEAGAEGRRLRYRLEYVEALSRFEAALAAEMPKVVEDWKKGLRAALENPKATPQERSDAQALLTELERKGPAGLKLDAAGAFASYVDSRTAAGVGFAGHIDTDGKYKFLDENVSFGLGVGFDKSGNLVAGPAATMRFSGENIQRGFAGSVNLGLGAGAGGAGIGAAAEGRKYLNDGSVDAGIADGKAVSRKGVGAFAGVTWAPLAMGGAAFAGAGIHSDEYEGHKRRMYTVQSVLAGYAALGTPNKLADFDVRRTQDVAAKAALPYETADEKAKADKLVKFVAEGMGATVKFLSNGDFDAWDVLDAQGERLESPERKMCLASAMRTFRETFREVDFDKIKGWSFQSVNAGVVTLFPFEGAPLVLPLVGFTLQKNSAERRESPEMAAFQVNLERAGDQFVPVDEKKLAEFVGKLGGRYQRTYGYPTLYLPLETVSAAHGNTKNEFAFEVPAGLGADALRVELGTTPPPENRPAYVVYLGKGVTKLELGVLGRQPGKGGLHDRVAVYVNRDFTDKAGGKPLDLSAAAKAKPAKPDAAPAFAVRAEAVQRDLVTGTVSVGLFGTTDVKADGTSRSGHAATDGTGGGGSSGGNDGGDDGSGGAD